MSGGAGRGRPAAGSGAAALETQLGMLGDVLDGATDAVYVKDLDGRYLMINRIGAELLGRSVEEVIGRDDLDLFAPDTARRIMAHDREIVSSGERLSFESDAVAAGAERRFLTTKWPWRDSGGQVLGVVGVSRDISEQRRAEEALRESEQRFRTLVEHAPEAIVLLDVTSGRFVEANSNAEKLFGAKRDELLHVGPADMSPPLQPDGRPSPVVAKEWIEQALAGGAPVFPWVHRSRQGEDVPCEVRLVRLPGNDEVVRGSVIDISERRRAQEEIRRRRRDLRETETRFRALVEHSLVGITIVQDRRVVFCNPAMAETLGYSVDEVLALSTEEVADLVHPEDREMAYSRIRKCVEGRQETARYAYRVIRKDGGVRWREALIVRFEFGGRPAVLVSGIDITAQRETEAALRESDARHRTLLEALPETVFLFDADGLISDCQIGPETQLLGPASELLGRHYSDVLPPAVCDRLSTAIEATREHGDTQTFGYRLSLPDQKRMVFEARVASTRGGQTVMVARNRTDEVALEEQLRQVQKMEAVGRLAGGVAHDFNNILTVVLGGVEIALSELDDSASVERHLIEVKQAAERATALTRQLLAFSRRQLVEQRILNLNELVEDAERMLRRLIEEDIELVTRRCDDLGLVRADPAQIEQVLINLVVNGRDAMPEGGTLTIETRNLEPDALPPATASDGKPYVELTVSDSGVGMGDEVKRHLFEPFFTTKEPGRGTGLGLATSYGIIEQHGGQLTVESELGRGTSVHILLPQVAGSVPQPGSVEPDEPPGGSESILVVEDDDAVRAILKEILEGLGYSVVVAAEGAAALELLDRPGIEIDLLLTDVVMPGIGGRELAERALESRPDIKVVFMSGYTEDVILERRLAQQGLELIRKPFRAAQLAATVRRVLDQ